MHPTLVAHACAPMLNPITPRCAHRMQKTVAIVGIRLATGDHQYELCLLSLMELDFCPTALSFSNSNGQDGGRKQLFIGGEQNTGSSLRLHVRDR
eukprot:COSAG05_NODE_461_length_9571_cov_14.935283_9_plen_95_part_00